MLWSEPFVFKMLSPLLSGRRARYQRSILAQKYLQGEGAEIGALMQPILTPMGSSTKYIDRVPASYWRTQADRGVRLVDPDIIDEGNELSTIADNTFDYLIAAHVLEHIEDPISALKNWLRVIKRGGHLLVAVPDKRYCGEEERPLTSVEHFMRDYEEGHHVSAEEHYRDFGANMKGYSGTTLDEYVAEREPMIHFHTFTLSSFVELLVSVQFLGFELLEASLNVNEDIAVLRRV